MAEQEKFSDQLDHASALQDAMNEEAIAKYRNLNKPESHPDFDGETCVQCGADMPIERLNLGKIRCFDCQTVLEAKNKRGLK